MISPNFHVVYLLLILENCHIIAGILHSVWVLFWDLSKNVNKRQKQCRNECPSDDACCDCIAYVIMWRFQCGLTDEVVIRQLSWQSVHDAIVYKWIRKKCTSIVSLAKISDTHITRRILMSRVFTGSLWNVCELAQKNISSAVEQKSNSPGTHYQWI